MTLRLPKTMIEEMVAHAVEDLPNECCGIVAGKDGVATRLYRTRNAEASPYRYNIDSDDLLAVTREIDAKEWDVLVIYHSHVASDAYPSPTDVRMSQWQGAGDPMDLYPGAHYVLVSLQDRDSPVVTLMSFPRVERITAVMSQVTHPSVRSYTITNGEISEEEIEVVRP